MAGKNKGAGRRWGRQSLGAGKRRAVDVWLDPLEEMRISAAATAAGMTRGRFIRHAALGRRVVAVPSVSNLSAWRELARLASNLNQLSAAVNAGRIDVIGEGVTRLLVQIGISVAALRAELIGVDDTDDQAGDGQDSTDWSRQ